ELRILEQSHHLIKNECNNLINNDFQIIDIQNLAGKYTQGGIHTIKWKSYLLKAGEFVEENCQLCPETTKLLAQIPGVHLAFFSILYPKQYIKPHFGYYKGFLRYHLGVIVPAENHHLKLCWLRVNDDGETNASRDKKAIEQGEKYYWQEGEGVIFDDTLLHDAMNDSDQIRVVLWLDIERPMKRPLNWIHHGLIKLGMKHPVLKKVRENAIIR
ncbi:MAG: aspartyl/asparaginyl beta-hydroxylase domain-containing protein, partial [Chloroflexota bacterium]